MRTLLQQQHSSSRFLRNISIKNRSEACDRAQLFNFFYITYDITYKCIISHPWIKFIKNQTLSHYSELKKNVNHSLKPKPQVLWLKRSSQDTVPFHSIRQSRITGPQKLMKCHDGHGHFGEVMKSFLDSKN